MNPVYANELVGRWNLETLNNFKINQTLRVDAQFNGDTISGFSSCNNYFGSYHTENKTITIKSIQDTRKFCGQQAYQLEKAYLNALEQSRKYEIFDGKLDIFNSEGIKILSFRRMLS